MKELMRKVVKRKSGVSDKAWTAYLRKHFLTILVVMKSRGFGYSAFLAIPNISSAYWQQ